MVDPADAPPLLEAKALSFARNDEPIFGPLDLAVRAGEALVVEGDNGAGKTTLVHILAGLVEPTAGTLFWQGAPLDREMRDAKGMALLGHQLGLKPELTPRENLAFRAALDGVRRGVTADLALRSVALEGYEDVAVRTLSAGQRKRTALAALLLSGASLWLLDEPYANLDRAGHVLVDRMLESHCLRGGAAILTSHGLSMPALARVGRVALRVGSGT